MKNHTYEKITIQKALRKGNLPQLMRGENYKLVRSDFLPIRKKTQVREVLKIAYEDDDLRNQFKNSMKKLLSKLAGSQKERDTYNAFLILYTISLPEYEEFRPKEGLEEISSNLVENVKELKDKLKSIHDYTDKIDDLYGIIVERNVRFFKNQHKVILDFLSKDISYNLEELSDKAKYQLNIIRSNADLAESLNEIMSDGTKELNEQLITAVYKEHNNR